MDKDEYETMMMKLVLDKEEFSLSTKKLIATYEEEWARLNNELAQLKIKTEELKQQFMRDNAVAYEETQDAIQNYFDTLTKENLTPRIT